MKGHVSSLDLAIVQVNKIQPCHCPGILTIAIVVAKRAIAI